MLCTCMLNTTLNHCERYETEGLNFLPTQKEIRKGPNNITDVWKKFVEGMTFPLLHWNVI